jgi:ELWxxDGT repeat protein
MLRQIVLFNGADASNHVGLWVTNGTAAGTRELTGISGWAGFTGYQANSAFTFYNGEVLFDGIDASGIQGLWVTDGTAAGTHELTGTSGTNPQYMTVFDGEVLFSGADASGIRGLWITNGTPAGTHELTGITGAYTGGLFAYGPYSFTIFNGQVLFGAEDAGKYVGLWVSDGTAAGTHELSGISATNAAGIYPQYMTIYNSEVLFDGYDTSGGSGLWVTNGTAAGTHELTGISGANTGPLGLLPIDLTVFNSEVLFSGIDASGIQGLWVTDGTAAGTHELTGISGAYPNGGLSPDDMTVFNGKVFFRGVDTSENVGLWVTDGTAAGTHELTGISGANSTGSPSFPAGLYPIGMTVFNGELLFQGQNSGGDRGLWVSDGTATGTHELTGINDALSSGFYPYDLTPGIVNFPPPDDFTGNGTADILFRNDTSGDTWFEAMSNGAANGWNQIGGSSTSYTAVGVGDFYGTGTSDILFRNNATGDIWVEAISNGVFSGWNQIGGSNTSYSVAGIGDFYGTGTSDILFRNTSTGDTWFEAISNGAFNGWHQIGEGPIDASYAAVGIGDFFGNGTDDILLRDNSTGDTWIEAISNGAFNGWHQIGGSDTHYSVAGVGDFFGNGTDDILFRNNSTGDTWIEAISNGAFASWQQVGGSNTHYSVVGLADFYGSGADDILFRNNSTGDTWFEAMSNGAFAGWHQVGGSNTSYSVPITVGPPALT